MSGKGNCYDNAVVETFFKTLKAELIWRYKWQTRQQVTQALFQYINGFYNIRRRHSAIRGISPIKFEQNELNETRIRKKYGTSPLFQIHLHQRTWRWACLIEMDT